ncbi:MAG: response regulator transcription factor [Campylobacterales bacterium]|nr:response regulator transcription factor [Campylobacterales bacterium]
MSTRLLLLEDDALFGESLCDYLEECGCEVLHVRDGERALEATYAQRFDCYLLDINVPLLDGLSLLESLRSGRDATPAIFLTSHSDKSVLCDAFERGCDDYLKKPFDLDELWLRIQALLRRSRGDLHRCVGALCVDMERKIATLEGRELRLSAKELSLLALLMREAGLVVSKEMIVEALWTPSEGVSDGAIRVYINRLKQELEGFAIENIRGVGYRLVP